MNFYEPTFQLMKQSRLSSWAETLPEQIEKSFDFQYWGDLPKWLSVIDQLPDIKPSQINLNTSSIEIGSSGDCDTNTRQTLELLLQQFHPWRKGPYNLFGVHIDAEWRSDLKWNRLIPHIKPLRGRYVLDVGCGNGYHGWRMAGEGAKLVVGIDPVIYYVMQFLSIQNYINQPSVSVLPLSIEQLPTSFDYFDTVFSMGLLYHRRSPMDHLFQLKSFLRDEGELVLETLIIENDQGDVLMPQDRYARMSNVWFIPSPRTLEIWMKRAGFKNVRLVDITKTTSEEQRVTDWIGDESLMNFLDPNNTNLTIEGYPAPKRAIFIAKK
ncbi:MAG: tRNA 5-methoxyuridine(34)/uridine 5-oxyacetic acid(34) synthase CmoB [Candidatus Omnitrophica bacterium]|nr:tRNA 5-methoxyuridine(34)/uridine 5-oxyacetic acid(34) synthase CmoB [Candidatus Omnitrophota bacterium]